MLLGHGFDIKQAEAVAFHIVQIAGGNAVELIEYMLLLFGSDTDSPVADRNFNAVPLFRGGDLSATNADFSFFIRVFDGVVNQVADDIAEMRAVCGESQSGGFDLCQDVDRLFGFQLMLLDERFKNVCHRQDFRMQTEGLAAFHAHGQYLLHKSAEPLQLFLADAQIFVALCLFFCLIEVQQSIVGGIGYGDRGFQLMGDIVGEITFHLFQCLLPQDGADEYPE